MILNLSMKPVDAQHVVKLKILLRVFSVLLINFSRYKSLPLNLQVLLQARYRVSLSMAFVILLAFIAGHFTSQSLQWSWATLNQRLLLLKLLPLARRDQWYFSHLLPTFKGILDFFLRTLFDFLLPIG